MDDNTRTALFAWAVAVAAFGVGAVWAAAWVLVTVIRHAPGGRRPGGPPPGLAPPPPAGYDDV